MIGLRFADRLSYANSVPNLEKAIERIGGFLAGRRPEDNASGGAVPT